MRQGTQTGLGTRILRVIHGRVEHPSGMGTRTLVPPFLE
jgi:hypothetical protein